MPTVEATPSAEETRRLALEERLKTRDAERLHGLETRRQARENASAENENVEFFTRHFRSSAEAIAADIADAATEEDKTLLPAHFERVNEALQKLTKYIADSKLFLPTYDLRKSQEKIDELNDSLATTRNALLPKKKFGFKNKVRKNSPSPAATADVDEKSSVESASSPSKVVASATVDYDEGDCVIKDQTRERLVASDVNERVVGVFRLADCDLLLRGAPSAVHVRDLRRCRLFFGPTSGSVFVDRCENCVFVIACQQLRIHTTKDSRFYIHVTSKAIVEDCITVAFAPYNLQYPGLDADYVSSGLNRSRNNWNDVDDFNYLATGSASPNWRILGKEERTESWEEDVNALLKLRGAS